MRRYTGTDERILTNILLQAGESDVIVRQKARYPVIDIAADEFDQVLIKWNVTEHVNRKTRGIYYMVDDVKRALKKLCLDRGVRPQVNPDILRTPTQLSGN